MIDPSQSSSLSPESSTEEKEELSKDELLKEEPAVNFSDDCAWKYAMIILCIFFSITSTIYCIGYLTNTMEVDVVVFCICLAYLVIFTFIPCSLFWYIKVKKYMEIPEEDENIQPGEEMKEVRKGTTDDMDRSEDDMFV